MRRYQYWGRHGYEHFYYFSTPLRRWWKFKGLIHWPTMPRPIERQVFRVLDVLLHYTGYRARYRGRMLKYLWQLRRERTEQLDRRKADAREWAEAMAEDLRSIGTPADKARQERAGTVSAGGGQPNPPSGTPLPAPDLSDMDRFHRMVATGQLVDIFSRLANGHKG